MSKLPLSPTWIWSAREPLYRKADVTVDTTGEEPLQSLEKLRHVAVA